MWAETVRIGNDEHGGRKETGFMKYLMALSQQYAGLGAGGDEVSASGISVVLTEAINTMWVCSGQQPAGRVSKNVSCWKLGIGLYWFTGTTLATTSYEVKDFTNLGVIIWFICSSGYSQRLMVVTANSNRLAPAVSRLSAYNFEKIKYILYSGGLKYNLRSIRSVKVCSSTGHC